MSDNNREWSRVTPPQTCRFKTDNGSGTIQLPALVLHAHVRTMPMAGAALVNHVQTVYVTPAGVAKMARGVTSAIVAADIRREDKASRSSKAQA